MNDLLTDLVTLQSAPPPSCATQLFPFVVMIFIFYFIVIRPQRRQEQERQDMLSKLKKGDSVITSGGLIGTIESVSDTEIKVEVADRVKVRVAREDVDLYSANTSSK